MEGYKEAPHRVAGHDGVLVDDSGLLFIKPTNEQELKFYNKINDDSFMNPEEDDQLRDWTPRFMGTLETGISEQAATSQEITEEMRLMELENNKEKVSYLVLENLLQGFEHPSIIDIKLGSILTDNNASEEKKERLANVSASTSSRSHHFRVCGMKLFHENLPDLRSFNGIQDHVVKDDLGYITFDKWYGRSLNSDTIEDNFRLFFLHNGLNDDQQQIVIRNTFTRLQLLYNCLISQEVRMRSSSLLIAYENDIQRWDKLEDNDTIYRDEEYEDEKEDNAEGNIKAPLSFLSLIDFAHSEVTPGQGQDEDLLKGIENLLNELEKLIKE